jgi:hypothetical protein
VCSQPFQYVHQPGRQRLLGKRRVGGVARHVRFAG